MADTNITDWSKQLPAIEKTVSTFFDLLGLSPYSIKSSVDQEGWILMAVDYDKQGVLIGHNGETLQALQLVLRQVLYHDLGLWTPLVLDVGGYLEKRKQVLEKTALNLSQEAKATQTTQEIINLSAAERRIVHLVLKDDPEVVTESEDTSFGRKLLIKPAN